MSISYDVYVSLSYIVYMCFLKFGIYTKSIYINVQRYYFSPICTNHLTGAAYDKRFSSQASEVRNNPNSAHTHGFANRQKRDTARHSVPRTQLFQFVEVGADGETKSLIEWHLRLPAQLVTKARGVYGVAAIMAEAVGDVGYQRHGSAFGTP